MSTHKVASINIAIWIHTASRLTLRNDISDTCLSPLYPGHQRVHLYIRSTQLSKYSLLSTAGYSSLCSCKLKYLHSALCHIVCGNCFINLV